ncbi:MAG: hypothetical protein ACJAWL_002880 [Motiliproteus sp.]|jgi:hypothetical protein
MISGISGAFSMAATQSQPSTNASNSTTSLSVDQRQLVTETLANFDPEQLTEADALSIVETFSEAGIQPGREMAQAISASGFDARSIGDLAGVEGPQQGGGSQQTGTPPPPPSQGLNISDEMLQSLNELLNEYYSDDLTEEEQGTALSSIMEIFKQTAPEDGLINVTA